MKKIISVMVTLALLLSILPIGVAQISAETVSNSLDYLEYEINDNQVTLTGCDKSISGELEIPSEIEGYPVTSIGDYAFSDCLEITDVTICSNVVIIGDGAFSCCERLVNVNIPDCVISLGDNVFKNCSELTSIIVDDNNQYYSSDDYGVLFNKNKTELIKFPANNTIEIYNIPDTVTSISRDAFEECDNLISIIMPDSVANIDSPAFENCSNLNSIVVEENNQYYSSDDYGVLFNKNKTELIKFPANNTIEIYNIPDTVISISRSAFRGCYNLISIDIPNGVTNIGYNAFRDCTNLNNITISDSVINIGDNAFRNTGFYNDESNWVNGVLYIDNHLIKAEQSISGEYVIKNGTLTIADEAFYECSNITNVEIPEGLVSIGYNAFCWCESLTSIKIPNSLVSIGDCAFSDCGKLKNIIIPKDVANIGDLAFACCISLENISIPEGITSIGFNVFNNCINLTSIIIPKSVIRIEQGAFYNCKALTDIWYIGSESDRENIYFEEWANDDIINAIWHYGTCENNQHVYTADCDTDCDNCDWVREIDTEHIYDNDDDIICNICNSVRDVLGDVDEDGDCDINDLKTIKEALLLSKAYIGNYDINKDGLFNICDYVYLYYSCYLKNN